MSQALYRKWRPARFDEIIGQEHITSTLKNSVLADRVGHAYLFCGPRGTGKTTTARLLAKAVNCTHEDPSERPCDECRPCQAIASGRFLDLIEIDAASNTGVDDIRDLRDKINFSPSEGRFKVYIIDEVHMLSTAAFNALLKTLEEPPPHAKFVLATTEEHKVPMTIKSRCQQFNFRLLSTQEILTRLNSLIDREGLQAEAEALALVAQHGAGSLRDAESLLDQLVGGPQDVISLERTQMILGTASSQNISDLVAAIGRADGPEGLRIIHEALATGADTRQFCRQMVSYLRDLLLIQTAGTAVSLNLPEDQILVLQKQAQTMSRLTLIEATRHFNDAAVSSANSWQPQLPLEMAFIESLPAEPQPAPAPVAVQPTPVASSAPVQASPPAVAVEQVAVPQESQNTAVAPPSPSPPPTATPSPPSTGLSLEEIKGKIWRTFTARAGQENRNIKAWLSMAQPLAIEGGHTLVIGFDLPFLRDKLESERHLAEKALQDVAGHRMQIKCVLKDEYQVSTASYSQPDTSKKNFRDELETFAKEYGGVVSESD